MGGLGHQGKCGDCAGSPAFTTESYEVDFERDPWGISLLSWILPTGFCLLYGQQ
jgi:hypothetical protein